MASKAQGQFTIIDYNDAITLTGFIGSNHPKTQIYNPDNESFIPNWSTTNLVLTPSLYVAGSNLDILTSPTEITNVQSVNWYEGNSQTKIVSGTTYVLSGTKNHILTVNDNILQSENIKDFICEINYIDPTTSLSLSYKTSISFSKVINGGGITGLIVTTPTGNVYKNNSVVSLTALAQLWRGSVIDDTNVTYQWYLMDSSVATDEGGGIGWKKLTNTSGKYMGVTTNTITLFAAAVTNFTTAKCVVTDTTPGANNAKYVDTASFVDLSDPIQVVIESAGGNVFKNGIGSSVLTAKVFQAGAEIDVSGENGIYVWKKYDNAGALVSGFNKTGKTLNVGAVDVDVKATFMCDVTI